jgi:hypothetical protein
MPRLALFLLVLASCGHAAQRRAKAIAKDDGHRVVAALESHENARGEYPPSLDAIDTVGVRTASMTYVRDGKAYTLVVGASAGPWGASCTRRTGDTEWSCRRWRK